MRIGSKPAKGTNMSLNQIWTQRYFTLLGHAAPSQTGQNQRSGRTPRHGERMKAKQKGSEPCQSPHSITIVFWGHTLEHLQVKAAPGWQKFPEQQSEQQQHTHTHKGSYLPISNRH